MADQLANLGADQTQAQLRQSKTAITEPSVDKKKVEPDWRINDPFGEGFDDWADRNVAS